MRSDRKPKPFEDLKNATNGKLVLCPSCGKNGIAGFEGVKHPARRKFSKDRRPETKWCLYEKKVGNQ